MTTPPDSLDDALRAALADEAAGPDDDALLERALARASATLDARDVTSLASVRARRATPGRRLAQMVVPIAAVLAASLAMASYVASRRQPPPRQQEQVAPAVEPAPVVARAEAPRDPLPSMSVDDLPVAAPAASAHEGRPRPAPVAEVTPAADLFRDANAARRSGDVAGAVSLYEQLLAQHPTAAESDAARVSLGRVLLDRRGDARGALAQFDAYLKNGARDRTLAEEARAGKATALERLGQRDEERRAWQDLLDNHPDSLLAPRARARLGASPSSP